MPATHVIGVNFETLGFCRIGPIATLLVAV